jgi:transcription initiation factor IIE alpha subunit
MTTLREAAQQALETMLSWQEMIEREWGCGYSNEKLDALGMTDPAITALRAALEQPERHVSYVCPQCHWSLEQSEQCKRHNPCERLPDGYCARCHSEMYP